MTTQFTKLTLEEAILDHQRGYLTTTGLVAYFFRIRLAEGWSISLTVTEITQIIGIKENTCYKALAKLRNDGELFYMFQGKGIFSRSESGLMTKIMPNNLSPSKNDENFTECDVNSEKIDNCKIVKSIGKKSKILENNAMSLENNQNSLQNNQKFLTKIQNESPKPLSDKESDSPPDYLQILFKSLSPFLQEKGVSDEKIFSFLEWWINQGMSELGFKINNPVAYLMSTDAISGEKRILLHFAHWEAQLINSAKPQETSANQEWEKVLALSSQMSWGQKSEEIIKEPKLLKAVMDAGGLWKIAQAEFKELKALKARFIMSWNEYSSETNQIINQSNQYHHFNHSREMEEEKVKNSEEENLITAEQLAELKLKLQNIGLKL